MFYGGLPSLPRRFSFIDMFENYFEGKVRDYAPSNASFWMNCLQNVSNQKTLEVCASFYAEKGLTFDNLDNPIALNQLQMIPQERATKNGLYWQEC